MQLAGFSSRMVSSRLCSGNRVPAWWSGEGSGRASGPSSLHLECRERLCYGHTAVEWQRQAQNSLCRPGPVLVIPAGISPAVLLTRLTDQGTTSSYAAVLPVLVQ